MWLYRALLHLYPRHFRQRYGEELAKVFADERAARGGHGPSSALRFWKDILADLIATATRLRVRRAVAFVREASGGGRPGLPAQRKRTEMDTVLQDIRYAFRQFVARPAFTAVAVLSLALAIGANSLIYGLLDGLVFNPFPFPDPGKFVAIGVTFPRLSSDTSYIEALSPAEYHDLRGARSFSHTGSFDLGNRNISGGDVPERVFTALLLDDLFPVVGMPPVHGRGFTREELAPGGQRAAIISHRLWQSRFGGDPGIVDRAIRVDGATTTVVGVMPPGLLIIGTDLWIPWGSDPLQMPRNRRQFNILARLAPGATLEQANTELIAIAAAVEAREKATFAEYEGWRLTATPFAAALLQDLRPAAFLLLGAVGLVLLIACANLTNLFLARSTTRQRELAVRLALGAARWRIARHLLTESTLLAVAGAAAGLLIAYVGLKGAGAVIPQQGEMLGLQASVNPRVLWWSLGLAIVAGLLVGLLPAMQAARTDPHDSLKADIRAGGGRGGRRLRHVLVVAEMALAVMLLLGAGLLMRSVFNIQRVDLGFEPRGVLTMRLTLPRDKYPGDAAGAFFDTLAERLATLPGVRTVSAASQYPPDGSFSTQFRLEGGDTSGTSLPTSLITVATPSHFEALVVALQRGRLFSAADRLDTPAVAIVNEAFVSRYFQGMDPIGQRVAIGSPDRPRPWTTIVGVTANYQNSGATAAVRPEIFIPVRQQTAWNQLFMFVRTDGSPSALLPAVRKTVASLDRDQPIYMIQTLEEAVTLASFQQRVSATLLSIFAGVALVLAAIGIYGVMSYSVSARTQEMGVRFAVGANRRDVLWLVLGQVLKLSALGLAIGIGVLLLAGRALEGMLFGVRPADPAAIGMAALALGAVALAAAFGPAFRASRVDPITALRYE